MQRPTYEAALGAPGSSRAPRVLDIGCGIGAFLRWWSSAAVQQSGIDASAALIGFARGRLPHADLRVGEMEELPWATTAFDLVTGFNSFFFANDMVAALREAGRVAKPGAAVVIQVWGAHEHCDLEAMKQIARPFLPPRPPDAPPDPISRSPALLEDLQSRPASRPRASSTPLGIRLPGRRHARPGAGGRRRSRRYRRRRARARAENGDRRRASPRTEASTGATGSRTSTTTFSRGHEPFRDHA